MGIVAERLDYLWFLNYGLDDDIPNHSVLSKARKRWGKEAFEGFFVRTVMQCVQAGLVDGKKLHVDSSLIDANASRDSVVKGSPELIAALKQAYQAQESKLEDTTTPAEYQAVNDRMMSTSDPDAAIVRKGADSARPRYHHHRAVDDTHGVITAVETTPGSIAENKKLLDLVEQHENNTEMTPETVVGDSKYGTVENFVACQQKGLKTHMGDVLSKQNHQQQVLIEGSFADAANNHGFKRSRWRRLWRQQIQDWMIAAIQNIRILMSRTTQKRKTAEAAMIQLLVGLKKVGLTIARIAFEPLGFWRERSGT